MPTTGRAVSTRRPRGDVVRVRRGDEPEIDDPGLGVKGAQTRGVRLELAKALGTDQLETGTPFAVPAAAAPRVAAARPQSSRRRFAAEPVRNLLLVAVTEERLAP